MSECYIGEIRLLPYVRGAPQGWQICDGSLLSIDEYTPLYQLIQTTYGGDGQSTFGVPDLRSRVPLHQGAGGGLSTRPLGQIGGAETVVLTTQQMGSHAHNALASTTTATSNSPTSHVLAAASSPFYNIKPANSGPSNFPANTLQQSGGAVPHDNTAPTVTLQYCIAYMGIYPTQ